MKKIYFAILAVVLIGCAVSSKKGTKPHKKYIKDQNYTPFTIPRQGEGVGTLISFQDGFESLIMRKNKCLGGIQEVELPVTLPDFSYELKESNKVELDASKIINQNLNLSGAFESNGVKTVEVTFVEPFEIAIPRSDIKDLIRDLNNSNIEAQKRCVNEITDRKNLLIERVLGAKKIKYRFLNNRNQAMNLNADILQKINITGERAQELNMSTSLDVDFPVIVGYRAWNIKKVPGLAETEFEIIDLSLENIEKLKKASKQ